MKSQILNEEIMKQIAEDETFRITLTKQSALHYASVYFPHYFSVEFAPFQYSMLEIVEDQECQFAVIITFRGSGKSTLLTTITPLWYIMGIQQKKCVLIVCQTQEQARTHMASIKAELEENELLRTDLGPFKESTDKWNSMTLEFSKYGAQITAVSIDQSIRGLRYKQYRPDCIICDDIEDSSSVKTKENRKHIRDIYSSEIAPLGNLNTKIILLGNYLHPNSLLSTLMESVKNGSISGKMLFVPLVDDKGQIAWPFMYPDFDAIKRMRERVPDYRIWMQEYMLKAVPDDDQLVQLSDIKWYDDIPTSYTPYFQYLAAGIDLAISKNDNADFTAVVSGSVYKLSDGYHVFITPNPTNKRLSFRETIDFLHHFNDSYPNTHLFVETTGYQESVVEQLQAEGIYAHGVKINNMSKKERLALSVQWIASGHIHFPKGKVDDLLNQMMGLGTESHDDLVDAFSLMLNQVMEYSKKDHRPVLPGDNQPQRLKIVGDWRRVGVSTRDSEIWRSSLMSGIRSAVPDAVWG